MAFIIIIITLLVQHYLLKKRPDIALTDYQYLFFDSGGLMASWSQLVRLLIWIFIPMFVLLSVDNYVSSNLSVVASLPLHFAVVFFACGYPDARQAISQIQKKETLSKPLCLFLEESTKPADSDFFVVCLISFRCLFCVLFMTFLFAGYGALLVMLIYIFAMHETLSPGLLRLITAIEWIPARLLYCTLALDNNTSALSRVATSTTNFWSTEKLFSDLVMHDIFEQNSRRKTIKLSQLWLRQLIMWLISMAIIYLVFIMVS